MSAKKLRAIARQFRVLKNWRITYGAQGTRYRNQAAINIRKKLLHVYPYDLRRRKVPKDYLLHEILHAAIIATREPGLSYKRRKSREEKLVQDLCGAILS